MKLTFGIRLLVVRFVLKIGKTSMKAEDFEQELTFQLQPFTGNFSF